ncbi:MAG: aminotransferase class IV [Campylobacteraceae bacterium]|nr:aminotransferase class IV [Campylobacteraceae bacterium]
MKKFISPCLETILCVDNKILHLEYHQKRFNYTRKILYGDNNDIDLNSFIKPPKNKKQKIRIIYDKTILKVEYQDLIYKNYKNFILIESNLDYSFKYEKRDDINFLKNRFHSYDDIIIYNKGFIKDTSIANIALKLKNIWYTPKTPLLKGTTRERLLNNGFLKIANIDIDDLKKSSSFAIMNAIIGFKEIDKGVFQCCK